MCRIDTGGDVRFNRNFGDLKELVGDFNMNNDESIKNGLGIFEEL